MFSNTFCYLNLSIYLSIYKSVYLSIFLSIYLSILHNLHKYLSICWISNEEHAIINRLRLIGRYLWRNMFKGKLRNLLSARVVEYLWCTQTSVAARVSQYLWCTQTFICCCSSCSISMMYINLYLLLLELLNIYDVQKPLSDVNPTLKLTQLNFKNSYFKDFEPILFE